MTDSVAEWLENSRETMVTMERDLKRHHAAVDGAMAVIRNHSHQIETLERQLEIIGNALAASEAAQARVLDAKADAADDGLSAVEVVLDEPPTSVRRREAPPPPRLSKMRPPMRPRALRARPEAPPLRAVDLGS